MNLRQFKTLFKYCWLCILPTVISCGHNPERSVSQLSQAVCECLNEHHEGDIDARMTPCINKIIVSQSSPLAEEHSQRDSVATVDAMISKETSKVSEVTCNLVTSCDAFGSEIEVMYDKWYSVDSSAENLSSIKLLSNNLQQTIASDTATKRILNELIARNIKARRLGEGLSRCQQMKSLYKDEGGAYFASAFVYSLQKKYPSAINELKKEIGISNDSNLKLIIEVMKRKARLDNVPID